jgi:catechol 2,3-dioxygenase-like lactoylglutathione lyase family enzyme
MSTSPALSRIAQIAIVVKPRRAIAFYRDVLGLQFLFRRRPTRLLQYRRGPADAPACRKAAAEGPASGAATRPPTSTPPPQRSRDAESPLKASPRVANLGKVDLWMASVGIPREISSGLSECPFRVLQQQGRAHCPMHFKGAALRLPQRTGGQHL